MVSKSISWFLLMVMIYVCSNLKSLVMPVSPGLTCFWHEQCGLAIEVEMQFVSTVYCL